MTHWVFARSSLCKDGIVGPQDSWNPIFYTTWLLLGCVISKICVFTPSLSSVARRWLHSQQLSTQWGNKVDLCATAYGRCKTLHDLTEMLQRRARTSTVRVVIRANLYEVYMWIEECNPSTLAYQPLPPTSNLLTREVLALWPNV